MNQSITTMINQAQGLLDKAYAPYSKFKVACCISTDQGNLYTGINIENGSYGLTLCAEASALCNMVSSGEQKIKSMVILSSANTLCAPCGACRQRIHEFSNSDTLIHLCDREKVLESHTITELLPLAFNFKL